MIPELKLKGSSIEEFDILNDQYFQLILLQYAIRSLELQISAKRGMIARCSDDAEDLRKEWVDDLVTLEKVSHFLAIWSDALNEQCPNPEE
ncbi:hypothetical protein [Endozoicomonas arenosclerae]|uniref:hypothetical protein n=1 Tax=Endozoicomonas arenosclerae TaxID=1633495 RepID=UPI000785FEF9|nr:hypothetical protein [Endozoicomonas arenosclerae]